MIDIVEMASRLASSGMVVRLRVKVWMGYLPPRPEWGDRYLSVIPSDVIREVFIARRSITDALGFRSIPCVGGFFVPSLLMDEWLEEHEKARKTMENVVEVVANYGPALLDAARSTAASAAAKAWKTAHKEEGEPPPSIATHAASIVSSLMPSREDIRERFSVARTVNGHYFTATRASGFIPDGEKRAAAWQTINELVAGNTRRLADRLEYAATRKDGHQRRFDRVRMSLIAFRRTDMMPELGLSSASDELYHMVEQNAACDVSKDDLLSAIRRLSVEARSLSTASDVIRRGG